ncbi:ABC transporter ATP-binding protein, partial [Peptostreptococcus anaerobius]|uniref:ABC transporter ATP-binding protein n=1 Tax=Peptostreptococcus anaerobius TaxID=1261 RepID=UPI00321A87DB
DFNFIDSNIYESVRVGFMIEIRELSFKYKGGDNYSLKDINLKIKKGECILLCGRSGCGKSTLLKLMNGIIPEFYDGDISGSVMVNGMNTFTTPIYKLSKDVGSVFQNPKTQFYTTNATDEIAFGLENYGIEREVINKRIKEVEKELRLENLMNKNIFNLSGGEKQKIAIASIYALNPEIFILDEPSSSLDIKSMKELSLTMKKLKSLGKTIIIAEHRLWYLEDIVDRAIYLEDGKIIREYSMDEIENLSEDERMRTGLRHSDYKAIEGFEDFETSNKGALLELKNLIFKRNTRTILSIKDLTFCYGNIIGIVGENGIGKSTLAKIICGLYKANKGKILKEDENFNIRSRLNESLLIMQEVNYQLFTDNVFDEILLTSKVIDKNIINNWLKNMELENIIDRNPHTLSGGQKQRVIILSALLSDKKILFFDEPTSGLDYKNTKIVAKNIKKVKEEDKLILIISHDIEFLESVCDKVIDFTYL